MFSLNDPQGIRFAFDKPQSFFGLTVIGHTIGADAKLKLVYYDADGKQVATVKAETVQVKNLNYDSRGAVFRGLATPSAQIAFVDLIPTHLDKQQKIVIAGIDYLCLATEPIRLGKPSRMS